MMPVKPMMISFVCLTLSFLTTAPGTAQNIIAYYSGNAQSIDRYPVGKLTHIIYSFCYLKGNRLRVSSAADSITIKKLVSLKQQYPALKILLSLGGWGGCKTCSPVFGTAAGRAAFAQSVAGLTDYFHTDGIDIDWEFPAVSSYPGHPFSAGDRDNFTALLQILRQRLGPLAEISFIAAAFSPYLQQSIDWKKAMLSATRVNLMTYDIIGSRSPITGHHASLYSSTRQPESTDHALGYLDSLGIPHSKIAIGVAFYAREFDGVPDINHGLYQPGRFKRFLSLKQVRKQYNAAAGFGEYWDEEAQAPYRYNASKKIYLTYDNERSAAAKAAYVLEKKLNGVMFWELRLDNATGGLTDVMYRVLRK
jgi:chitinase